VSGAILGARTPDQLAAWLRAGSLELNEGILDAIADALEHTFAGSGPLRPPSTA